MPFASICRFRLSTRPSLGVGTTRISVSAPCFKPNSEEKSEVRAVASRASSIMRTPAIGVGVPGPGVPEVEPAGDPVLLVPADSHVRAAKMPRDISSSTRPILTMAMSKRRRFLNVSFNLLKSRQLLQLRQSGPPLLGVGGSGGGPAGAVAGRTSGAPAAAGTVAVALDDVESKEPVVAMAIPSCSSSGTARPQRKMAGIIAIKHSTIEVKKTAL